MLRIIIQIRSILPHRSHNTHTHLSANHLRKRLLLRPLFIPNTQRVFYLFTQVALDQINRLTLSTQWRRTIDFRYLLRGGRGGSMSNRFYYCKTNTRTRNPSRKTPLFLCTHIVAQWTALSVNLKVFNLQLITPKNARPRARCEALRCAKRSAMTQRASRPDAREGGQDVRSMWVHMMGWKCSPIQCTTQRSGSKVGC